MVTDPAQAPDPLAHRYPFWPKAAVSNPYHTRVPLAWIHLRSDIREDRVRRWLDRIEAHGADDVPPIEGVKVYQDVFLQDGNHRVVACRRVGLETIKARLESIHYDDVLRLAVFAERDEGYEMRYPVGVRRYENVPEGFEELEGQVHIAWHTESIDDWQYEHLQRLKRERGLGTRKLERTVQRWLAELD
ncbi:MAG: hypothetical protein ABEL51_15230 [Salinibacter sp.]